MTAQARFAALLAVVLTIGVGRAAWGSNGDPVILGHTNTARAETVVNGGFGSDFLQSTGDILANGWVSAGSGITLEEHSNVIGQLKIQPGRRCAVGPTPARDPGDDQSTPMIFTSIVGFPHGTYIAGSEVTVKGLKVCLNRIARTAVKVNWVSIDMDTLN